MNVQIKVNTKPENSKEITLKLLQNMNVLYQYTRKKKYIIKININKKSR